MLLSPLRLPQIVPIMLLSHFSFPADRKYFYLISLESKIKTNQSIEVTVLLIHHRQTTIMIEARAAVSFEMEFKLDWMIRKRVNVEELHSLVVLPF